MNETDPVRSPEEGELDTDLQELERPELAAAIRAALEVPTDLRSTARRGVDRTLAGRSLTSTVTDIAGSGMATVWHLLTNPPGDADRDNEMDGRS